MNPMQAHYTVSQSQVRLSAHCPVRVASINVAGNVLSHDHAYTEICIVESGSALHVSEVGKQTLSAGGVAVVHPGPCHAFEKTRNLQVTNIYYLAEWFLWDLNLLRQDEGLIPLFFAPHLFRRCSVEATACFSLTPQELHACSYELENIRREYQEEQPSAFLIRGAFSKLLVFLSRAWLRQYPTKEALKFRPEVWRALCSIDGHIQEGELFCVEEFARSVGLSPDGFSRIFSAATGHSPTEYFQSRRVQHASHLLLRSEYSISEIAHRLGYADAAHLTRFFQKHKNCSPKAFRKLYLS